MIELSHIYKTYPGPVHALRDVDLKIEKGEFVFLTGPSGAGKSTLFKMLSAFDRPTSGAIRVAGYDLSQINGSDIAMYRRRVGVVFQDFKLLRDQTVYQNVALPLQIKGEKVGQIERKVNEVLQQVGLASKADFLPDFISGGEQQRVAIARAIVHQPGLLIADEPTGNLDPQLSEEIIELLQRICAQGTTVFVATHDMRLIEKYNKRRIRIQSGAILGDHQ